MVLLPLVPELLLDELLLEELLELEEELEDEELLSSRLKKRITSSSSTGRL